MLAQEESPLAGALDRLESTLARLENAAREAVRDDGALDALTRRHETMRARVADALGQIDELLGELETQD